VLTAEYGVSHATIGRAVDVLVQEGRVAVVRGWGTFVAER
jgi:DNA-binding GntR family transcriptional regulator